MLVIMEHPEARALRRRLLKRTASLPESEGREKLLSALQAGAALYVCEVVLERLEAFASGELVPYG